MDIDDPYVTDLASARKMGCQCAIEPIKPNIDHGCQCPGCGSRCKECIGHGYAVPPVKRFHQILSRIRSQIRRRVIVKGHPPGFIRLTEAEINVILRKRMAEDEDHWVRHFVDVGPPVRVFDVLIVKDRRKL